MHFNADLKPVAIWANQFTHRILFEWVWDGAKIYIVQADVAKEPIGVDPMHGLSLSLPEVTVADLSIFRIPSDVDFENFQKLRNVGLYTRLKYSMPPFYILDTTTEIQTLKAGEISGPLRRDLQILTQRPLIMRIDGRNICKQN